VPVSVVPLSGRTPGTAKEGPPSRLRSSSTYFPPTVSVITLEW
jgi:hypothetical protein